MDADLSASTRLRIGLDGFFSESSRCRLDWIAFLQKPADADWIGSMTCGFADNRNEFWQSKVDQSRSMTRSSSSFKLTDVHSGVHDSS